MNISHFTNLSWAKKLVFYEFWFKRHNSERFEAQIFPTKFMLQQIKEDNLAHLNNIRENTFVDICTNVVLPVMNTDCVILLSTLQ